MPMVERAGVALHYQLLGDRGDPLLLLMGLGVDHQGWLMQSEPFAERHRVVLVDNRGVGGSGKPRGPYTTAEMADDAAAVLDAAGIARAHVVGLSMGGMIAQELALRHRARVAALVLAATYGRPGREVARTEEESARMLGRSPLAFLQMDPATIDPTVLDPKLVMRFLMPLVFSKRFLEERRDFLRDMFNRALAAGFSIPGLLAQVGAVMRHDTTDRLAKLDAPTLIIHGTADELVPFTHGEELARLIPGARLVPFEGGVHGFNFEEPEKFNRVVLEFLAAHAL